jgi:hypothetical protein
MAEFSLLRQIRRRRPAGELFDAIFAPDARRLCCCCGDCWRALQKGSLQAPIEIRFSVGANHTCSSPRFRFLFSGPQLNRFDLTLPRPAFPWSQFIENVIGPAAFVSHNPRDRE